MYVEMLNLETFSKLVTMGKPYAQARVRGAEGLNIGGTVLFYKAAQGAHVVAEVFGLPQEIEKDGKTEKAGPFYAFHIHDGADCGGGERPDPFTAAGEHYNPTNQPHPLHAGDMPPLLGDGGYAYLSFYTGRFAPEDVVGRTVIIHQNPDDFRTQPSGMAGLRIACGEIMEA